MNEKFRTTLVVEDFTEERDRENKMLAWKKIGFGVNTHDQEDQFYVFGNMNAQTIMNALIRLKAGIKEAIETKNFDQVLQPAELVEIMFKFDSKYETNYSQDFQADCALLNDYYQNQGEEPVMSFEKNAETPATEEKEITNTPETNQPEEKSGEPIVEEKKEETQVPENKEEVPAAQVEEKKEEVPPSIENKETPENKEEVPENKEPERNITVEVVSSGDLKVEDIIEIGPKGVSNKQMIPAMKKAVEEKSTAKLALLKTTYPEIYESSIKYIGHKRQQELKTLEESMAAAQ